ncbi:MAG TPA: ABC transporter substrate-binding protein [Candidatus Ozemobacteraceae bacterium]|nr:ABC transporter substrate-binding protein [Candidatus Ozemobacteraceae bacterium]
MMRARAMRFGKLLALIACGAALAFTTGCGSEKGIPERVSSGFSVDKPDILRLGLYGDALELSPISHHGEYDRMICNLVHAAPLKRSIDGKLEPDLFASWVSYPDEKGRLIVDAIWKSGLRWHDGTTFDPKALAFTFAAMRNPANASPYAALASQVVEIDQLDRGRRIRIVFAKPSRRYLELLTAGLLPPHLLEGKVLPEAQIARPFPDPDLPPAAENASPALVAYSEYPVGLGAFRLTNRKRGRFIELESAIGAASDSARPNFTRILFRCHPQLESLLNDFRQGKLDWIPVPSEIASKIEELRIPGALFHRYPNPGFFFWGFNLRKAPFDQIALRTALDEGLNRGNLRAKIPYEGEILKSSGFLGIGSATIQPGSGEETASDSIDLSQALETAGIRDTDGDGRRDIAGKPFSVGILVNEENLVRKLAADEIASQLKRAGVNANVEAISWSDLLGARLASSSWDSFLLAFQLPRDGNAVDLWHSGDGSGTESLNFCGVADPELDAALDQLDTWPENATPSALLTTVSARLQAVRPGAFLFRPFDVAAWRTGLTGPERESGLIDMQPAAWKKNTEELGAAAPASAAEHP